LEGKSRDDFFWGIPGLPQPNWLPYKSKTETMSDGSIKQAAGTGETRINKLVPITSKNDAPSTPADKLLALGARLKQQVSFTKLRKSRL
jgi:hypothetical protein